MSFPCPHCGGEIVPVPGSSPLPGWRNPDANGRNLSAQTVAQTDIARGSEDLGSEGRKTYNLGYTQEFLVFWGIYPRKRDKRKAFKAWRNAIRRNSPDAINAGAERYRDDPNRLDEFTKYAEGWLNGDGWEDEPLPSRLNGRRPDPPRPMTSGEMDDYIKEAVWRDD